MVWSLFCPLLDWDCGGFERLHGTSLRCGQWPLRTNLWGSFWMGTYGSSTQVEPTKSLSFLIKWSELIFSTSCIDQMKLKRNMEESLQHEKPMQPGLGRSFLRHAFAPKDCCLAVVKALLLNFQRWSNTHDCWIIALGSCKTSFCLTVVDLFFDTFHLELCMAFFHVLFLNQ